MATRVTLGVIDQKLDNLISLYQVHAADDKKNFDRIFVDNGKQSLVTRITLLEEAAKRRQRGLWLLWGTVASLAGAVAMKFLFLGV